LQRNSEKAVIGMTNLGVITDGAMHAMKLFREAGHEVIVFHAIGAGGRAMEQLMKEGHIQAVFDYALGEISDEVHGGFRSAGEERLTVAGKLGLPQVLCPGGTEHIGLFTKANVVPEEYKDHVSVFHNPIIFVPRLNADDMRQVAKVISERLQHTSGKATMLLPMKGTSRYCVEGAPLYDAEADAAFFEELQKSLPRTVEVQLVDAAAEDDVFVEACVNRLLAMLDD
jgi:uncharacterized protein (UPF0261 family)